MLGRVAFAATAVASVQGVLLLKKEQQPAQQFTDDDVDRHAMFDCSGGAKLTNPVGASDSMATRIIAAKAQAITGSTPPENLADLRGIGNTVQEFDRHAAQDCEGGDPVKKKDLEGEAPYVKRKNFHGKGTEVEEAQGKAQGALEKAVEIRKKYLGEQFAKVEDF